MRNLKYWLGLAFCGLASHAFAQNEVDALRYSQLQFGGSARTLGIGGANVALGGDIGTVSSNPAGLGLFQQSEVSFTPGYGVSNTSSVHNSGGSSTPDSKNSLHVGGFGIVFANRRPDNDNSSDWRAGSFAISMTRTNNFNTNFSYRGTTNDQQSLFQRFREPISSAQEIDDQFYYNDYTNLDGLAYGAYLTNLNGSAIETIARANPIQQFETVTASGGQSQYDFAYGASYRDKLYIGGAIGIVSTRFNQVREFEESDADASTKFQSLNLYDRLDTRGTGFNLRFGAIYRANDILRIGASVQTPTWSRLTDSYSAQLGTVFSPALELIDSNGNTQSIPSGSASIGNNAYTYSLTMPFRANGGVAVLLSKYGFLSGDIEYVNYAQARLNSNSASGDNYSFADENQAVQNLYRSTVNLRFGGEARYNIFRLRLGYARYGDPYVANEFNRAQNYFTGGLGLRQNNFYLDLAGVYNTNHRYYSPYTLAARNQPVVSIDENRFTTSVTVGLTF